MPVKTEIVTVKLLKLSQIGFHAVGHNQKTAPAHVFTEIPAGVLVVDCAVLLFSFQIQNVICRHLQKREFIQAVGVFRGARIFGGDGDAIASTRAQNGKPTDAKSGSQCDQAPTIQCNAAIWSPVAHGFYGLPL